MSRAKAAVALALAAAVAATCAAGSNDSSSSAAKLAQLRAQIAHLSASEAADLRLKHHELARLANLEEQIGSLQRELAALAGQAQRLSVRRHKLAAQSAADRTAATAARQQLAAALRAAFLLGREPEIKLALEGDDPAAAARLLGYYGYYVRARGKRIADLSAQVVAYDRLRSELAATGAQLARTESDRRHSLASLRQAQQERRATVAGLNRKIADKRERIAALRRDAARLENVVRSVSRTLADVPAKVLEQEDFGKLRGRLPWPVSGRIVDGFGSERAAGELKWEAVQIAAPAGARVHAVAYGRIAYAGWLPYYGLVLIVDHGDGYLTVYGHNQALYKQVGDWVQAGEVIATVGASGGQPKPVLYFQIRHNDRPLDPARWCRSGGPA